MQTTTKERVGKTSVVSEKWEGSESKNVVNGDTIVWIGPTDSQKKAESGRCFGIPP